MVGLKFSFDKIDKYYLKIHSIITIIAYIKFNFLVERVELHLDVVLEVLLVVRFEFLSNKIPKEDSQIKYDY